MIKNIFFLALKNCLKIDCNDNNDKKDTSDEKV